MQHELAADIDAVRSWAAALRRTGDRLTVDPPPPVPGAAHADAIERAQAALVTLAGDLAALGRAVLATLDDYEAVDAAVAARLGRLR